MSIARYRLICFSPVHVGTGRQFGKLDAVYVPGRWCLIDLDQVLSRGADANELAEAMNNPEFSWTTWLRGHSIGTHRCGAVHAALSGRPG